MTVNVGKLSIHCSVECLDGGSKGEPDVYVIRGESKQTQTVKLNCEVVNVAAGQFGPLLLATKER